MYCEICGKEPAERHHIVFKSQGGLDIDVNFIYLCPEHHRGPEGPHMCKKTDLMYKQIEQEKLFKMFGAKATFKIKEISGIIRHDKKRLERKFVKVKNHCGEYAAVDIVRALMGGRLY